MGTDHNHLLGGGSGTQSPLEFQEHPSAQGGAGSARGAGGKERRARFPELPAGGSGHEQRENHPREAHGDVGDTACSGVGVPHLKERKKFTISEILKAAHAEHQLFLVL